MRKNPLEAATLHGDELIHTPIGDIELRHSYFDDDASRRLFDEMDFQRACQAYLWSHPIVSMTSWRLRQGEAFGVKGPHDFVVLNSLKEKRGIVTGNLSTPYILQFTSLKDGPLVVEYPGGMTAGGFIDLWQRPVADTGLTGPDGGKGGTYVVVGPEGDPKAYEKPGVFVVQSATNAILFGARVLDPDPAYYARFKSSLKMGRHGAPLATCPFIENRDVEWSATAPRGLEYWQRPLGGDPGRAGARGRQGLDGDAAPARHREGEALPARREAGVDPAEGRGDGRAHGPQPPGEPALRRAVLEGHPLVQVLRLHHPAGDGDPGRARRAHHLVLRGGHEHEGMVNPVVGKGQVYMTTKRDAKGNLFRADRTYRLRVPKDVPVAQFWALTLYSENTRRPYDNGGAEARSINLGNKVKDLKANADGSVDLFIGAKAPAGFESNFMKTVGEDGWFVYFRLYAPLQPFFDKSFSLADFELVEG